MKETVSSHKTLQEADSRKRDQQENKHSNLQGIHSIHFYEEQIILKYFKYKEMNSTVCIE